VRDWRDASLHVFWVALLALIAYLAGLRTPGLAGWCR